MKTPDIAFSYATCGVYARCSVAVIGLGFLEVWFILKSKAAIGDLVYKRISYFYGITRDSIRDAISFEAFLQ